MAIDDEALRRLQVIGLRQGRLTAEDIKQVLPVDAMSAEQLAQVILRLQNAGIDIEIDEDLLAPRHPPRPNGPMPGETVILPADGPARAPSPTPPLTRRGAAEPEPPPPEPPARGGAPAWRPSRAVTTAVVLAVIILVIAALIVGS